MPIAKFNKPVDKRVEESDLDKPLKFPTDHALLDNLTKLYKNDFDTVERLRKGQEDSFISDLRQTLGVYHPDILADIDKSHSARSKVYYKYTQSKERPMVAKLNGMLFPDGDDNWDVTPSGAPRIADDELAKIYQGLQQKQLQAQPSTPEGQPPQPSQVSLEDVRDAVFLWSKKRAENMRKEMRSQLGIMDYVEKSKRVVRSAVRYGTGILRGPLTSKKKERQLNFSKKKPGNGMMAAIGLHSEYSQDSADVFRPSVEDVSIWDFFPDNSTTDFKQCQYAFILHSMTRHEMRNLSKNDGFFKDRIYEILEEVPNGNYKPRNWEQDLTNLQENKNEGRNKDTVNRYEVIERDGFVDGLDLVKAGLINSDEDADKEWLVNMWFCAGKCIRAKVWPDPIVELTDLYHLFYYIKDETSIFGTGLPYDLRDLASAMSASMRLMLNNAIKSSDAIREINTDLLSNKTGELPGFVPGEVITREGMGSDAQYPLIRDYKTDSHVGDYLNMIAKLESCGDKVSGIPESMFSATESNETKKAFAGRSANVTEVIRDFTKNFDRANESFLMALYRWNMEYSDKEDIKGDMDIVAVGSSTLLTRETQLNAMQLFMSTMRPEDWDYVDERELLTEKLRLVDLHRNVTLKSEKDVAQIRSDRQKKQEEQMQMQMEAAKADIGYTASKANHMNAKAGAVPAQTAMKQHGEMLKNVKAQEAVHQGEHQRGMDEHKMNLEVADRFIDVGKHLNELNAAPPPGASE